MIGCWPASFSRLAASVENPVFVFFCGASPSSSNSTCRSWGVELTLKSCPAASTMATRWRSTSATRRSRSARSSSTSTPTPRSSMRASTPTSGTSMSSWSERRPWASSAAMQRGDEAVDRERTAPGDRRRPGWTNRRGRAGPRRRRRPRGSGPRHTGPPAPRAGSGSPRDRAGRRRARCRARGSARRCRAR